MEADVAGAAGPSYLTTTEEYWELGGRRIRNRTCAASAAKELRSQQDDIGHQPRAFNAHAERFLLAFCNAAVWTQKTGVKPLVQNV